MTIVNGLQYKRLYLSGKMTGLPDHGFTELNRAAADLRERGYEVFNPAEVSEHFPSQAEAMNKRPVYMFRDIIEICGKSFDQRTDAVAVLPNWYQSRGARLEVEIALQLDIPVVWAHSLKPLTRADFELARLHKDPYYLLPNYQGVAR